MKKFTLILSVLLMALFLFSCDSDDNPQDENPQQTSTFIKTIALNGQPTITFSYNGLNQLTNKAISVNGNTMDITYTYSDGLLASEKGEQNGNTIYQYTYEYDNDNKLSQCNVIGTDNVYWSFIYNGDKIVEAYQNLNGGISIKHIYAYNGDNIIKAEEYYNFGGTWMLQSSFEFEYDAKRNPIKELNIPFSEVLDEYANFISANNATIVREFYNGIQESQINYTYTYNADQYPISVNDGNNNYTFTYQP